MRVHALRLAHRPVAVKHDDGACAGETPHLLANCLPPLIAVMTVKIAHAIALEATLSFLGAGVPLPEPSLGLLIANGCNDLLSDQYISLFPGIVLVLTIVSINLLGDRMCAILGPRL